MPHRLDLKVRFYELDPYGHLNHAAYIQLFETARVELLDELGLGLHDLLVRGFQFVVVSIETAFLAPVGPGTTLTIETSMGEVRRASSRWSQTMLAGHDLVATQELRSAITDRDGRPTRAPADIVEKLSSVR